jgi:tetratricopeptide (TPR) repeat protein
MSARLALLLAAALALCACRHREITKLEREQAANEASEADFAVTVKEFSRAEGLYAKAAAQCPDTGDYWLNLGIVRVRLGDRGGARAAYKSAEGAYRDAAERDAADSRSVIRRIYVLVVLGRPDDARAALDKARARSPGDRVLKSFNENGGLQKMLADPALKSISP